jgi:hypothetical protein
MRTDVAVAVAEGKERLFDAAVEALPTYERKRMDYQYVFLLHVFQQIFAPSSSPPHTHPPQLRLVFCSAVLGLSGGSSSRLPPVRRCSVAT